MHQPLVSNSLVTTASSIPVHPGLDDANENDDDVDDESNIHFDSMWCNDEYMKLKDIVDFSTPYIPNNSQIFSHQEATFPNRSVPMKGDSSLHLANLLNMTKNTNNNKQSPIGGSASTFNAYDEIVSRPYISLDMLHSNSNPNAKPKSSIIDKVEEKSDSSDSDLEKRDSVSYHL